MSITGTVFDIQRFAVHDGPGIRTTVFLKGCSNRCGWCHNPESLSTKPQLQYYPLRCVNCMACREVCPKGAHVFTDEGHNLLRDKCDNCGACVKVCNTQALLMAGKQMTVSEVMSQVLEDSVYYKQSGGGMTLSGGEPVLQAQFCAQLLKVAHENNIHTAIETAGYYPFSMIEPMLGSLDLILFDLKAWSESIYREHIGGKRDVILNTLQMLDETNIPIIMRTPVIGSVNDNRLEIEAIAKHLVNMKNLKYYMLLPYHGLGKAKYDALGQEYTPLYFTPPKEQMERLEELASKYIPVYNQDRGFITT